MAYLLLLVLSVLSSSSEEHDWPWIGVDDGGVDQPGCIHNSGIIRNQCRTLDYVADHVNSTMPIRIAVGITGLNKTVTFENSSDVTLHGVFGWGQITCVSHGAGLVFHSVQGLEMENLEIRNCGALVQNYYTVAVSIQNCTNVAIKNVVITLSERAGLAFFETYGKVLIERTHLKGNGGTGVYTNFASKIRTKADYKFSGCSFERNNGQALQKNGGGLDLSFNKESCFNKVILTNCTFTENYASWGGGLYITFNGSASWNNVTISGTTFSNNTASLAGGGADIGYHSHKSAPPFKNTILFQNCQFHHNQAKYGGGTALYSSHGTTNSKPGETVTFENCTWLENSAFFSPAVDISPYVYDTLTTGFLPVPVFTDCQFISNALTPREEHGTQYINAGSFMVTKFNVHFGGRVTFMNNDYSALRITSGTVEFQAKTNALFLNNSGTEGGAIALYGFSSLHIRNNSVFKFINNSALDIGGAIYYHSFDQHDFVSTRSCFIQYIGPSTDPKARNITFQFTNNTASNSGKSVYALSFYPCYFRHFHHNIWEHEMMELFQLIGNFTFDDPKDRALATAGHHFKYDDNVNTATLPVIPGRKFKVPIKLKDELNKSVSAVYRLCTSDRLKTDRSYTTKTKLRLYGQPGINGTLVLRSLGFRQVAFPVRVSLLHCPPGYFLHVEDNDIRQCECAAYYRNHAYTGMERCNSTLFQAYIMRGYWAGYPSAKDITPDGLHTAPCPLGFCSYELQSTSNMYLLPNVTSGRGLNNFICGKERTSVLCGKCQEGLSVHYHSRQYKCSQSGQCHLGLLYYILSELVPLVVLFTTVIAFDICFTSGTTNGFVFFSQVLDSLSVDAKGAVCFPSGVDKLKVGYNIIYGLFNFDFFSAEFLSFCLWKGAAVLDVLAFKYVTTLLAFGLVLCLVATMRRWNCKAISSLKRKVTTKNSVINGLSAFLVMCYAQCTRVSFQILTPVTLMGKGGQPGPQVSFFGGIPYLGKDHLPYAIPACFCLAVIVIIPPLLLLVYPLHFQILAYCGLSESKTITFISIPAVKLKPLLDSFQGCFKDKLRFFAGLYFVYRFAILAAYAFSMSTLQFYIIVEVLVIVMLGIHAVAQPYETRQHNIIDALIFVNIALINGFTIYNYSRSSDTSDRATEAMFWIQLVLIYLPIIGMFIFAIGKVARNIQKPTVTQDNSTFLVSNGDDTPDHYIDHEQLPYLEFELIPAQHPTDERSYEP